jgi:rare lipoprotein A
MGWLRALRFEQAASPLRCAPGSPPIQPFKPLLAALACLLLANCTVGPFSRVVDPKYGVPASPRLVEEGQPVPKGGGYYRIGQPYMVAGRTYIPEENPNYRTEGLASWYGSDFHGRMTANGEIFDKESISAAHPTLPIPSYARVTNLVNRRSIIVRVNDRGPFAGDRVIDVSHRTAELLGFHKNGLARVRVEYVGKAALEGSDDRNLMATLRHDGSPAPMPSAVMLASTGGPFVPAVTAPLPAVRSASIPSPINRPFELGGHQTVIASNAVRPARVADAASADVPRAGFVEAQPTRLPVVPASGPPALMSGRGLY